jgi:hypothetical protein
MICVMARALAFCDKENLILGCRCGKNKGPTEPRIESYS